MDENKNHKDKKAKFIVMRWKDGELVTELSKRYHRPIDKIRDTIIEAVGEEEYRRINKSRTGGASKARKAKPHYPEWMNTV